MLEVVPQQTCVAAVGGGGGGRGNTWRVMGGACTDVCSSLANDLKVGMLIGQTSAHIISMQL